MFVCAFINFFNFNFILPKVKTYYKRQAQVLNIDNLRLIFCNPLFQENVDKYMQDNEETAESALKKLDELHNKYKYMELNLNTKKER